MSDNEAFALKIETEDSLLLGHLVLYHQVNNGIQLWHSDYHSTFGTEAFLDEVSFPDSYTVVNKSKYSKLMKLMSIIRLRSKSSSEILPKN